MESSVRYVQLPNAGQKPALCFRGSKFAYAVFNEGGRVRSLEINLKDYDKAVHVKSTKNGGEDYSPIAFREAILRIIQKSGSSVTIRAQTLLEKGMSLQPDESLPEEEPMPAPKDEGNETIAENSETNASNPETAKPKVRKLPKRINRQGKAEDPNPLGTAAKSFGLAIPPKRLNGSAGAPRSADPARKPGALLPLPNRAAAAVKSDVQAKAKRVSGGKTLVAALAAEAGLSQQPCRVKLRAAGLRAPYDEKNEAACRKALGLPTKGKK